MFQVHVVDFFDGSRVVFVDFQVSGLAQRCTWISIEDRLKSNRNY